MSCNYWLWNLDGDSLFLGSEVTILNDKYIDGNIQPSKVDEGPKMGGKE
ncbi:MAG: hypothetical protein NWE80_03830 [Candidatus Bathyarchaeota archaeon]|nr:hypothetical protein [Candidatus Bathyarchaeota archaeon]